MLSFSLDLPWTGFILTVLALGFSRVILTRVFLSPLRQVPGPWLAKVTGYWLIFVDLAGNRTSTIHRLHQKYGSAVRIGPHEISFSNIECIKEIYGQQTVYMKAPVYETFSLKPLGIFSMRRKQEHSQRRKPLSHAFAQSTLNDCEPLIVAQIDLFLRHIQSHLKDPVDVFFMFRMLSLDIVGELFLGKPFGALVSDKPISMIHDMDAFFLLSALIGTFPWLSRLLSSLPISALQNFFVVGERFAQYGRDAFDDYIERNGRESKRKDLLTKVLVPDSSEDEAPMTDVEISQEVVNLVFAATDTTSTTLIYLVWELTQNPHWQDRLRTEIRSVQLLVPNQSLSYRSVSELPVLDAIVNESLRLHPAAPGSLQRITPAGERELGGLSIPEDTIVSMQCYTTQRDPYIFHDPETFDPERWLEPEGITNDMKEMFMPFSKGTRACLGKNMALMELKLITVSVIQRYVVTAAPNLRKADMEMQDHFLAIPKGGRCDLVFSPATYTEEL